MSTNDCQSMQLLLSAYHDGELSTAQSKTVAKHIESCTVCTEELRQFVSLGAVFSRSPVPATPAGIWQKIEAELPRAVEPVSPSRRFGDWFRQSSYGPAIASTAASILVLVGLGIWYGGEVDHAGSGGRMAMPSHGEMPMDPDHMKEFAGVMDDYLQQLSTNPDQAEQMLLAKYHGEKVDAESAVRLVGYRPIVSGGLPDGYSLASTSVLEMPCCTCVKAVCKRNDGSTLVLFEHDDEEAAWFGNRPSSMAKCGDKSCCLVDLDSSIAATWKQGTRSVTAVGVRDEEEVAKLVDWLGKGI